MTTRVTRNKCRRSCISLGSSEDMFNAHYPERRVRTSYDQLALNCWRSIFLTCLLYPISTYMAMIWAYSAIPAFPTLVSVSPSPGSYFLHLLLLALGVRE